MTILDTQRLTLREFTTDDAPFMLAILNDPAFVQFVGDRGVRTVDEAREYLRKGPIDSYQRFGFGLYLVTRKDGGVPVGTCGLIKRDTLDDVDVGFAFLPAFRGLGYATEAGQAVMEYGTTTLGLTRIVAITSVDNDASSHVLEKLGLRFERLIRLAGDDEDCKLFGLNVT